MADMGWDQTRTVPWKRLIREWLIYVTIMAAILLFFFRDSGAIGALAGLLASGPLYLAFGFVLAKFGYTRRSLSELREAHAEEKATKSRKKGSDGASDADASTSGRPRPAPTKRTSGGGNRPKTKPRRR